MLFNSFPFIFIFLPITAMGFFSIARASRIFSAGFLAAASLFFYAWWDPWNLLIIAPSIALNFVAGRAISHRLAISRRFAWVILCGAVGMNLFALGYFKYANFIVGSLGDILGLRMPRADITLPIGISFFTFTQIAYLVDVWRGKAREYNPVHYALFVTYFPHLIAGPILHHGQMMPQFANGATYVPRTGNLAMGISIFTIGLAKKVLLADMLAPYADAVFDSVNPGLVSCGQAWQAVIAYTFQIYFDFSGYSDMAIGLSLLFGITLPLNFLSPYKSTSIIEFWRRWHISLSTFLRDYLYISLGGNRRGRARRYINLFLTMLLGGLWHGANWTFVCWGGLHGIYLIANHAWLAIFPSGEQRRQAAVWTIATMLLTFTAVAFAWVFFRAHSVDQAMQVLGRMVDPGSLALPGKADREFLRMAAVSALICWFLPNTAQLFGLAPSVSRVMWKPTLYWAIALALLFVVCVASLNNYSQFIYFQF